MKTEIKIVGFEKLIAKLEGAMREDVITRSLQQSGIFIASQAVEKRMSGPRPNVLGVVTGVLSRSVLNITANAPVEKQGNTYIKKVGTNVIYARIHEFGGVIRPGLKGFLAWKDRETGKWVYTKKSVRIPARPYLRPTIQDKRNQEEILNILTRNINEALEK